MKPARPRGTGHAQPEHSVSNSMMARKQAIPRALLLSALLAFQGQEAPLEHDHAAFGEILADPREAIDLAGQLFDPPNRGAELADLVERVL